jgi:hypothetical protein
MNGQTEIFKAFPQKSVSRTIDTDLPAMKGERQHVYMNKLTNNPSNQQAYITFNSIINTYLDKLPNNNVKKSVESIMRRDLVYIARSIQPQKNGVIGGITIDRQNRLAGVLVDSVDLGIDFTSGATSSPDEVIYGIYFQYIRSIVLSQINSVRTDRELHKLMIKYLKGILLKAIGKTAYLFDKQQELLDVLVTYVYYRFQLGKNHEGAAGLAVSGHNELKDELKDLFKVAAKYKNSNDIFVGLTDFNIISEPPNRIIMDSIQMFKLAGYYSITTSLDYLIGFSILSKYPVEFFRNGLVNTKLADAIETHILSKYASKMKFNLQGMS